jgi:uncharacterized protein (DUF2461 family)
VVEKPDEWRQSTGAPGFADAFKLEGESLKRAPKGHDPDHPLIEDLRRKDFIALRPLTHAELGAADLPEALEQVSRPALPFMKFLCDALDLPF